ncbi:MAG: CDP-6-deoxy-delta-3,4-glucoseen reductase [Acidiferrobacterales bacterium]
MSYKIRIEPSGRELVAKDGEPILEAALRQGVALPYSCRNGACGACKGKIIGGTVDYGVYERKALPDAERAVGKALFCQAVPREDLIVETREISAAEGIAIKTLPARVVRMEHLASDVMVLYLKLPQTQRLQFLAGQYIDILLRDGHRRSFSLANSPHADEFLQLHVRQVPDGEFTNHVFSAMKERDLLRFQGPYGIFFLRESSQYPILFMAGGTGFAPIKSIIEHALVKGERRQMHLFWGARREQDLYMHELALSWARDHAHFHYTPVLSEIEPEDRWDGRTGWVHDALLDDYPDLGLYEVYASGPPPMIEAGQAAFNERGLPDDQFFFDSFEFNR